jgi:hypothetical protein
MALSLWINRPNLHPTLTAPSCSTRKVFTGRLLRLRICRCYFLPPTVDSELLLLATAPSIPLHCTYLDRLTVIASERTRWKRRLRQLVRPLAAAQQRDINTCSRKRSLFCCVMRVITWSLHAAVWRHLRMRCIALHHTVHNAGTKEALPRLPQ